MYGGMREPSGTEGVTAGTESEFFSSLRIFCPAVRVSWPVSPECFVPDVFRSMHMVGIQKPGQTPDASGICRKTIVSKFFLPAMSVGVLHVRCGRGITRCLSDIVGRRVARSRRESLLAK